MIFEVSANTKAILLLTAPLIVGREGTKSSPLSSAEYVRIARKLRELNHEPADFLGPLKDALIQECERIADPGRLESLLRRGFLLSQAIDRWASRAIWVISRADAEYPHRFRARVRGDMPPVLYGCGDPALLKVGGLAVVGSRHVSEELTGYAERVGRIAAGAGVAIVSGGARGIDQAAMAGSLKAGGVAVGVLADKLERAALDRDNRRLLLDGRLILISPYDPSAGFNVGHAMRRNKLVYALADAALVISSDYRKGGTWTGAVEQLDKLKYVPLFVRATDLADPGLNGLQAKGAMPWQVSRAEELNALLEASPRRSVASVVQSELPFGNSAGQGTGPETGGMPQQEGAVKITQANGTANEFPSEVHAILSHFDEPRTEDELANALGVAKTQARQWLRALVEDGMLERLNRPVRYRAVREKRRNLEDT